MQVGSRLEYSFRARDEHGHENEVAVYIQTSRGKTTGDGASEQEHVASTEARVRTGPFAGPTFTATFIAGDVYAADVAGPGPKITRIRSSVGIRRRISRCVWYTRRDGFLGVNARFRGMVGHPLLRSRSRRICVESSILGLIGARQGGQPCRAHWPGPTALRHIAGTQSP